MDKIEEFYYSKNRSYKRSINKENTNLFSHVIEVTQTL